jgi:protein SCO1
MKFSTNQLTVLILALVAMAVITPAVMAQDGASVPLPIIANGSTIAMPDGGTLMNPPMLASDFTLVDQYEEQISLSDFAGQTVLLSFGYTGSPAATNAIGTFLEVKQTLGAQADNVAFVFITVDERDSSLILNRFFGIFDPNIYALTSTQPVLEAVADAYGVTVENNNDIVTFSQSLYVLDGEGNLRVVYPLGTTSTTVAGYVQSLQATF